MTSRRSGGPQLLNIDLDFEIQGKAPEDLTKEELEKLREFADSVEGSATEWRLTPEAKKAVEMARAPTERPDWISASLWGMLGQAAGHRRWVMNLRCREGQAGARHAILHVLNEHVPGQWSPTWNQDKERWETERVDYLEETPDKIWDIPLPASDAEWRKAVRMVRLHEQTADLYSNASEYELHPDKPDPSSLLVLLLTARWKVRGTEQRSRLRDVAADWGIGLEEAKLRIVDISFRDTLQSGDEPTRIRVGSGEGSFYISEVEFRERPDGTLSVGPGGRGEPAEWEPEHLPHGWQIDYIKQETLRRAKEWLWDLAAQPEDFRADEEVSWPTDSETGERLELRDPDGQLPDEALIAEENQRTVDPEALLEIASPQQREIILARAGSSLSTEFRDLAEISLTADEKDLLDLECRSWADVGRALDLAPAQVRNQVKRLRRKLG